MRPLIWAFGRALSPLVRRFYAALDHPQVAQQAVQADLCDRLMASDYGKAHHIRSVEDWDQLPIVDYDDLQPWITRQIHHPHDAILTPDPILFWENTSGSRGSAKTIPYTRSLRQSFSHLFCIWAYDLIQNGPSLSTGKVYFCVSPHLAEAQPPSPSPLTQPAVSAQVNPSLQNDSDYLDQWLQWVLSPFLVTVPQMGRIHSAAKFKDALCLRLLAEERLEIISVWSPSFLTVQMAHIQHHRARFLQALGTRMNSRRRDALMSDEIAWTDVWPHLKLISCWDSVAAAEQANTVRSHFPGVYVQGKGLLATEAPMTVPLIAAHLGDVQGGNAQGYVPLLNEVFFEFEAPDDEQGHIYRLHELEVGQPYSIIISQKGGLYRYRVGDRIRVTHTHRNTPCLEFLGRSQWVSDLVGEKLNIDFVTTILAELPLENASFKSLVPIIHPHPHYLLLLDRAPEPQTAIAHQLETALCRAYHYHHARLLGQLAPAQVAIAPDIVERVTQHRLQTGQYWGDMKFSRLETKAWNENWLKP